MTIKWHKSSKLKLKCRKLLKDLSKKEKICLQNRLYCCKIRSQKLEIECIKMNLSIILLENKKKRMVDQLNVRLSKNKLEAK